MNKSKEYIQQLKNKPYVTYGFILLNLFFFLSMEIAGFLNGGSKNIDILLRFGAMERGSILVHHEFYRFIFPMFLHIGWSHLILNGLTLFFIGTQVEFFFGHFRLFLLYLLSGLFGNVFSFTFGAPNTISAGASTSLFGLFASFLIIKRIYPNHQAIDLLVKRYLIFIGMNLLFNLFSSSVDMSGHIGGLIGGLLIGDMVSLPAAKGRLNKHERIVSGLLYVSFLVIFIVYGFKKYGFTL